MIITINNQKGGVAKTTTAQALARGLNLRGYKTLAIDLDPQGNLSHSMKADTDAMTIYEAMSGKVDIKTTIQTTEQGDIIPSNILLSGADLEFTKTGREYLLKEILKSLEYDFIILDTPPNLGILTINALTTADKVIIPMGADVFSLKGLEQLYGTIEQVKKYTNRDLEVEGILLTRYNGRTIINRDLKEVIEDSAKNINTKVFKTEIRDSTSQREAQAMQESIFDYAPKSKTAEDYNSFINELLGVE